MEVLCSKAYVTFLPHRRNVRLFDAVKALLYSDAASKVFFPKHREIKSSTYGVIFLGTPHRGTIGASIAMISENISRLSPKLFPLTAHLPQNFEWLQSQSSSYLLISKEFVTKCYYENRVIPGRQKLVISPGFLISVISNVL